MAVELIYPAVRPSLDLNFARSKTVDPRIAFTRASGATYYDGRTVAKAEENLLVRSQEFGTSWSASGNVSVASDATLSPDSTVTADSLIALATVGSHSVTQATGLSGTGQIFTASVYLKAGSAQYGYLSISSSPTGVYWCAVVLNLSSGLITQTSNGTGLSSVTSSVIPVGSGWYRLSLTATYGPIANTVNVGVGVSDTATPTFANYAIYSWTASGSESIYAWGAQLEQRSQVTAYTPTTAQPITNYIPVLQTAPAGVPRFDHDPVTGESLGLLVEDQRTNLFTQSEFGTGGSGTGLASVSAMFGPSGAYVNAIAFGHDGATSSFRYKSGAAEGTQYTISVYVKMGDGGAPSFPIASGTSSQNDFALVIGGSTINPATYKVEHVGNSLYRISGSAVAGATAQNSGIVKYASNSIRTFKTTGWQLEAGSFPTSYIKTEASQVTRAADSASMTGTNFSSWYRQDEGAFLCDAASFADAPVSYIVNTNNGLVSNRLAAYFTATAPRSLGTVDGAAIFQFTGQPATKSCKTTFAYAVNNFAMSTDGSVPQTDTDGTTPLVNQLNIGHQLQVSQLNGHIKRLAYYPKRLSDTELKSLTT